MKCLRSWTPKGPETGKQTHVGRLSRPSLVLHFDSYGAAGCTGDCALDSDEDGWLLLAAVSHVYASLARRSPIA
jgi:hypothetical protein